LSGAGSNENEDSKAVRYVFLTFDIENLQKHTMIFLNLNFTILYCNCVSVFLFSVFLIRIGSTNPDRVQ
jgi:hypothetical protein